MEGVCEQCEGTGICEDYCTACNGSGEGMVDGSTCQGCKGKGLLFSECENCEVSDE